MCRASVILRAALAILVVVSASDDALYAGNRAGGSPRPPQSLLEKAPEAFRRQFVPRIPPPNVVSKSECGDDWRSRIDAFWGPGPTPGEATDYFMSFWTAVDRFFACFQDLDVDWDTVAAQYLPELTDSAVSRGRLSAILTHTALTLHESHTSAFDVEVTYTELEPGVPLLYIGVWGVNDHFGAGLTPLPDSSLLVYRVCENHPLELSPGDIVLGYGGRPWKQICPELIAAELPITGYWWGSSESAYVHSWLMAAGMNWHLFDTIDVVKYTTHDTVHLSTKPLSEADMSLFATEQVPIQGVPMPNYAAGELITEGIIEGTNIGYIYCWGWFPQSIADDWMLALAILLSGYDTEGLIIDFRTNYGGYPDAAHGGFEYLFDFTVDELAVACRADMYDHFAMEPSPDYPDSYFVIQGDPATYYDRPIAVLIGPGCMSAGDVNALQLSFHPYARFFGKPTSAAFNNPRPVSIGTDIWARYSKNELHLKRNPGHYLTRDEFPNPVDFPWAQFTHVWLTPDGVAAGRDDVVEAAIDWIRSVSDAGEDHDVPRIAELELFQNRPNPFNAGTTIGFYMPKSARIRLEIFNVLGQRVALILDEHLPAGYHQATWNAGKIPSGAYISRLTAGRELRARKILLVK